MISTIFTNSSSRIVRGEEFVLISRIKYSEMDETDYLLSNAMNKKILLQRIEDIKNGENIVTASNALQGV